MVDEATRSSIKGKTLGTFVLVVVVVLVVGWIDWLIAMAAAYDGTDPSPAVWIVPLAGAIVIALAVWAIWSKSKPAELRSGGGTDVRISGYPKRQKQQTEPPVAPTSEPR